MPKILVTGADGQLGNEIQSLAVKFPNYEMIYTDLPNLDITDKSNLYKNLEDIQPSIILNCSAYTAVDKAESEPELAHRVNALALKNLGEISQIKNIYLVHISTDFVFDGEKSSPYTEEDTTNPLGIYGKSKLEGEKILLSMKPESWVIRTSWLYSSYGKNFVKTMIQLGKSKPELGVIFDQVGTPTYAKDLAYVILNSLPIRPNGIYHFSGEGVASWYDFARKILKIKGIETNVKPIETSEYPTPAKRPRFSVLNKKKIKSDLQIEIPHWEDSLETCLQSL
jgi:dTDP-4-dehydrorhamnose reductase